MEPNRPSTAAAPFPSADQGDGPSRPRRPRALLAVLTMVMLAAPVAVVAALPRGGDTVEVSSPTTVTTWVSGVVEAAVELVSADLNVQVTTVPPTTEAPTTTVPPTTEAPTTLPPTTLPPTTLPPTTLPPTTLPSTTLPPPPPPAAPGLPPDSYWDRMAVCETGGNWAHFPNGTWTGGLGIYNQTWRSWGGGEFAPTAGQASRAQQIIVANRIAVTGHNGLGPVGFTAWGCYTTVGSPG